MKRGRGSCPYLDTVDRSVLDFDYEKVCSVTLSTSSVYACLVCGAFFRGRAVGTPAHTHSLAADHHVFLCLATQRAYCLPDDYEIGGHALDDVRRVLDPRYSAADVAALDSARADSVFARRVRCLAGTRDYLPGFVGLNNLACTDAFNAVVQCLAHVPRLRDYLLRTATVSLTEAAYGHLAAGAAAVLAPGTVAGALGTLVRKMWSPYNYRAHVSPHELVHVVQRRSRGRFRIGTPMEPLALLQWLLHELRCDLAALPSGSTSSSTSSKSENKDKMEDKKNKKDEKEKETVIDETFQGTVEVTTTRAVSEEQPDPADPGHTIAVIHDEVTVRRVPFYYLSLDLPPMPLFKDGDGESFLPQVPIMTLLHKYDGRTEQLLPSGERRRYQLLRLPPYLIVHIKRFTHNNWFLEKNTTIVNFPLRHLDLRSCLHPSALAAHPVTRYDLVTMLKHDGAAEDAAAATTTASTARASTVTAYAHTGTGQWYELQDLSVRETIPDLLTVSEAYIQIYQLQSLSSPL